MDVRPGRSTSELHRAHVVGRHKHASHPATRLQNTDSYLLADVGPCQRIRNLYLHRIRARLGIWNVRDHFPLSAEVVASALPTSFGQLAKSLSLDTSVLRQIYDGL
jgi:hypothetical protein